MSGDHELVAATRAALGEGELGARRGDRRVAAVQPDSPRLGSGVHDHEVAHPSPLRRETYDLSRARGDRNSRAPDHAAIRSITRAAAVFSRRPPMLVSVGAFTINRAAAPRAAATNRLATNAPINGRAARWSADSNCPVRSSAIGPSAGRATAPRACGRGTRPPRRCRAGRRRHAGGPAASRARPGSRRPRAMRRGDIPTPRGLDAAADPRARIAVRKWYCSPRPMHVGPV